MRVPMSEVRFGSRRQRYVRSGISTWQAFEHGASWSRRVPSKCPSDERVRVSVSHLVFGLEQADDCHVSSKPTFEDDLLPVSNRATVLLLD